MFRLRRVSFRYGPAAGIEIDELDIAPQGVTAVIGPSGSGKTTLLSILAGFVPADVDKSGIFTFGGRPVGPNLFEPGEVGFVFQSPMLLGAAGGSVNMLAGHAVRQRRCLAPINRSMLVRLVGALGLNDGGGQLLAKRARQLSGGEAQRVAVLRALLADPEAILCDEPTSSLDTRNAGQVMEVLREWAACRGRPVVWVTHNLDQAAQYADHFIFLREGRIFEPSREDRQALASKDPVERLDTLRKIVAMPTFVKGRAAEEFANEIDESAIRVGPNAFNRWIARALSTDSGAAAKEEQDHTLALSAPEHVVQMDRLLPQGQGPGKIFERIWARIRSYTRRDLMFVLALLIFQILAALAILNVGETYYQTQLRDPALWRLTFSEDNLSELNRSRNVTAPKLNPANISDLSREIAKKLDGPQSSVSVIGRRFLDAAYIRIPSSSVCYEWTHISTLVLSPRDPILHLADFGDVPEGTRARAAKLAKLVETGATKRDPGLLIADRSLFEALHSNCGPFSQGAPIYLEWARSDIEKDRAVRLKLADTVVRQMPPVHPYSPRIIIFEPSYKIVQQSNPGNRTFEPGFQQASAYLPGRGLATVEALLKRKGYSVTDDSRAAMSTLERVAEIVNVVPLIIVAFNLAAAGVSIFLIVAFQLELNRRVLTLFLALGFRLFDIAVFLVRYLAPAVILPLVVLWVVVWTFRPLMVDTFPKGLGSLKAEFLWALINTTWIVLLAFALAVVIPSAVWWFRTARRLTENLRE